MKTKMKSLLACSAAGLCVGMTGTMASAALVIELENGASTVTVTDNGVGDTNPSVGTVSFIGAVGDFDVNVTTGVSKPTVGSTTDPKINLNSVNVSSSAAGTLVIRMTDTDYVAPVGAVSAELGFGGTTNGVASIAAFLDASNTEFGMASPAGGLGPFGPGPFDDATSTPLGVAGTYSATLEAVVIHDDPGDVTSFGGELRVVPEPGSLALLALGGATLAFRRRRSS